MTRAHRTGFSFFVVGTKKRIELGVRRRVIRMVIQPFDTETSAATRWKPAVAGHHVAAPPAERAHTLMPFVHASPPLLDFSRPKVVQRFPVINHVIMGGVLTSRLVSSRRVAQWSSRGRGRSKITAALPRCMARSLPGGIRCPTVDGSWQRPAPQAQRRVQVPAEVKRYTRKIQATNTAPVESKKS